MTTIIDLTQRTIEDSPKPPAESACARLPRNTQLHIVSDIVHNAVQRAGGLRLPRPVTGKSARDTARATRLALIKQVQADQELLQRISRLLFGASILFYATVADVLTYAVILDGQRTGNEDPELGDVAEIVRDEHADDFAQCCLTILTHAVADDEHVLLLDHASRALDRSTALKKGAINMGNNVPEVEGEDGEGGLPGEHFVRVAQTKYMTDYKNMAHCANGVDNTKEKNVLRNTPIGLLMLRLRDYATRGVPRDDVRHAEERCVAFLPELEGLPKKKNIRLNAQCAEVNNFRKTILRILSFTTIEAVVMAICRCIWFFDIPGCGSPFVFPAAQSPRSSPDVTDENL